MLVLILLALKFVIFTGAINVQYNRISTVVISTLISGIILFYIYSRKSKNRNRNALIFYSLISIIMVADATYYGHFNALPNILALKQASQLTAVGDSLKQLMNIRIILLIIDIPFLIYLYRKKEFETEWSREESKQTFVVLTTALVVTVAIVGVMGQIKSVKAQELYTYHVVDIKDTLLGKKDTSNITKELTEEDIKDLKERGSLKEGKYTGIGEGRNLIVLQIEALQDFVIGLEYNGQEVTPNLNRLIEGKGTLYFDDYHQLLGRGNTSDAEFVTNNSLYPSMEEPTYSQYEKNTFYGLPLLLKDKGYTPWAFHGFEKSFWNREKAYVNQGFERFLSEEDYEFDEVIGFGIRDEDFYPQTVDYLKELDSIDENPFYAFIVSLSSHTPFNMPDKYNHLELLDEHKDNMIGGYIQSVHYADKEIGKFIESLKKEGLYDNSVIAIYGDHFGISAAQPEAPLMESIIGREYDYDDMMNIPLIIHTPGYEHSEKISNTGSQLDFYPTILNILGYENEKGLVFGRDLVNYEGDNYVGSQTYMLKGSFIDRKSMLEISRDGIFEHSRYIDRETREELDLEDAKPRVEEIREEIEKSNFILENNILKEMVINEVK